MITATFKRSRHQTRSPSSRSQTKAPACFFCVNNGTQIDEKDVMTLRTFLSSHGKIAPRRRSGLCALHQRKVARAVKRARILSFIPFAV